MRKFLVIPGPVSTGQGEEFRHITGRELITLYKVNPADCVVWEPDTIYPSTMTVLRPRRDGRYTLPEESSTR